MRDEPGRRNGRPWARLAASLLLACARLAAAQALCEPRDGLSFICGPSGSEDLARIPGTAWLIASGLNLGSPAHLFLIDTRTKRSSVLFPSARSRTEPAPGPHSHCPGPPDLARMSTDGLGLREGRDGHHTLYAANHGDRKAIEFFRIDAAGDEPRATWVDCAPLPSDALPNAVVPLPGGALLVSSFYDPNDASAWTRMAHRELTGRILRWDPQSGFSTLSNSQMSGANGLEVSADGRFVYASAWSARKLVILSLEDHTRREIALDFMPDNVHRLEDGSLLVAGQRTAVGKIAACDGGPCPQPWTIVRIDLKRQSVQPLLSRKGSNEVNYACGALRVGDSLYFSARGPRAVGYIDTRTLPSLQ